MRKKILALLVMIVCMSVTMIPVYADDSVTIEYFEDGSYIVSSISNETGLKQKDVYQIMSTDIVTKSKTSTYYNSKNVAQWYIKVTGTYTYGDGRASCSSASISAGSYVNEWKVSNKMAWISGASATASATGKLYAGSHVVETKDKSVTLTCTSSGTFY